MINLVLFLLLSLRMSGHSWLTKLYFSSLMKIKFQTDQFE